MNKLQAAFLVFFMFSYATIVAQDKTANFGIKGGINYGKYTPNQYLRDYNYQVGFYVGGFYKIEITDKMKFQPELLFALQGSKINTKDNPITDFNGNPLPYTGTFDFEYQVYEFTISIPLPIKLYFSEAFYMESGPQLGFIIDRNLQSSQILLDGNDSSFIKKGNANFDFGVCLGTGYDVSDALSVNIRAFTGLIERE